MTDREIIDELRPYVEQAIRENPGADASDVATAAMNLMDPGGGTPLPPMILWWMSRAQMRKLAIKFGVKPTERDRRNIRRDNAVSRRLVRPAIERLIASGQTRPEKIAAILCDVDPQGHGSA
jgi:hypothetical protein